MARTTRQREAGEQTRRETRRRLLVAAREEFAERGYGRATVARIAERAGVTVPTLYSAWGSKRELLRGVMESAVSGSDDKGVDDSAPPVPMAPPDPDATPHQLLVFLVRQFRLLAERSAFGWRTYRDAAAIDPEAADDWTALMEIRRANFRHLIGRFPTDALRPGLSREAAADTAWVIASPDTYDQLVRFGGYTLDEFEEWVATTMAAAILATG
ncbi:helix-turn-helix domain-containing protein [Gordonia sp. CPCC 205515]|uniref:TetR/AcrR family transcriptional regulator n=1 Tax=Gordonia sp. CPCC 205515 TaxID=3140791 RepID=UPI003AF3F532